MQEHGGRERPTFQKIIFFNYSPDLQVGKIMIAQLLKAEHLNWILAQTCGLGTKPLKAHILGTLQSENEHLVFTEVVTAQKQSWIGFWICLLKSQSPTFPLRFRFLPLLAQLTALWSQAGLLLFAPQLDPYLVLETAQKVPSSLSDGRRGQHRDPVAVS